MKILIGGDQYPEYINGAAGFTDRLARGLAARGHRVTVLWPSAVGPPATYTEAGMNVHRLRSFPLPRSNGLRVSDPRSSGRAVAAVLDTVRPDVVHIQSHMLLGRQLARTAVRGRYPLVATNHFMPENVLDHVPFLDRSNTAVGRWAWRDLARVYGQADLVTAPTPRAVELLRTAAGLTAVAISCGIDPERFWQPNRSPRIAVPTVLFVGRLETEKHIDELLRAFAGLPPDVPARLHIVGSGTQRDQLVSLADNLGLGGRVTFAGRVEDAELVAAYRSADIFAMPGTAELQSLATLEAMSAGKPVIAADAMALPHLVTDDHNGYLYTPGQTQQLTDHLTTLLTQPALRRRLGSASRFAAERHSIDHTLDAFEGHYARLSPVTLDRRGGFRTTIATRRDSVVSTSSQTPSDDLIAA
jgi:phosphatidylinositol alpha 1,6-mannosyltransferase